MKKNKKYEIMDKIGDIFEQYHCTYEDATNILGDLLKAIFGYCSKK